MPKRNNSKPAAKPVKVQAAPESKPEPVKVQANVCRARDLGHDGCRCPECEEGRRAP